MASINSMARVIPFSFLIFRAISPARSRYDSFNPPHPMASIARTVRITGQLRRPGRICPVDAVV